MLIKYSESLDSDKSYVAGKIFHAFIAQAHEARRNSEPKARKNGVGKNFVAHAL